MGKKNVSEEDLKELEFKKNDKVIMEFEMRVKSEVQEDDEKKEMKEFEKRQGQQLHPNHIMPAEKEKEKDDDLASETFNNIETYDQYLRYLKAERQRDVDIEERYKKHLKAWQSRNAGNSNKLDAMLDRLLSKDKEPTKHYPKWKKWHAAGVIEHKHEPDGDDNKVTYYDIRFKEHAYDIGFRPDRVAGQEGKEKRGGSRNKKSQVISTFTLKKVPEDKLQKILTEYQTEAAVQNDQEVVDLMRTICDEKSKSLQWVLSANFVKDTHATFLAQHLRRNTTVEELNLYNNELSTQGGITLGEALRDTSTLTMLVLSKNHLDDQAVVGLCEGIKVNPKLEVLKLGMNRITDVGVKALAKALHENTKLNHLELQEQDTAIGLEGAVAMGEVFAGHVLIEIPHDKWNIQIAGNVVADVGELDEAYKKYNIKKGWEICGINGTRVFPRPLRQREIKKDEDATAKDEREKEDEERIARRLKRAEVKIKKKVALAKKNGKKMKVVFYKETCTNKALKYVRLNVDIIEDRELISDATFRTMDMNQLKLVRRSLTGKTQILQKDKNGLITEMEPCKLGDVDATIISNMMKCNTGVRQMFLNQNKITHVGAKAISEALEMSMVLTTLSLSDNRISDEGISHIVEALKNNKSLVRLDIINIGLTDYGATRIGQGLKLNSTLKELAAGENDEITQRGFDSLVEAHKCDNVPEDLLEELDYSLFFQQRWHTIVPPRHLIPFINWLGKTKGISY